MAKNITLPYNWMPRTYQIPFWQAMEGGTKRAALVWHRRAGKDDTGINWCATAAFKRVGLYWHMLPTYKQGRQIVWNGRRSDGTPFLGAFPDEIIKRKRDDEMLIEFVNGSIYQVVGTDDVDRLVGTNPVGVILSEYSLHDPAAWDYIRPILAENGGWAVFIYTARGRNHGYDLYEMAKHHPDWFCQLLTVDDTKREDGSPVVTQEAIQAEADAGMAPEIIQQEFYCSFDAALVGAYYKTQIAAAKATGRIGNPAPLDPSIPVDTIWDLGIDDAMAIGLFQRAHGEIRCVGYIEAEGEGLQYYAELLRQRAARDGFAYGEHYAPHDIEVRELSAEGRTRREVAQKLGIRFNVVPKLGVADGIQAVRTIFPKLRFDNSKEVDYLVDMLSQYQKEWDSKRGMYRDKPRHDHTSHGADMIRYMAVAYRSKKPEKPRQEYAQTGGSPYETFDAISGDRYAEADYDEFGQF